MTVLDKVIENPVQEQKDEGATSPASITMTQFSGSSKMNMKSFWMKKNEQESGNDSKEKKLKILHVKLANSDTLFVLH